MRCDLAQRSLGEAMDEGHAPPADVITHVKSCAGCTRFERGAWRVRGLARFAVAPDVPDLTGEIMTKIRSEAEQLPRRGVAGGGIRRALNARGGGDPGVNSRRGVRLWILTPLGRAAVMALVVGFASGAIVTRAALVQRETVSPALAREIPNRLVGAAEELLGYRATFDVTELNWTRAVPRRSFVADIAFRAPEAFRVRVTDDTHYPSGAWPRNDLELITDGRTWRATGPEPCPRAALPACPRAQPLDRTVTGRAPFDAATAMPTDVIVPMTVLAAAGRVGGGGPDTGGGREAVLVRLTAEDGASLFQYLRFMGSWRPFFPQDRIVLWLDRDTWFPLRYEVFPAPGAERSAWASQNGFPVEPADRAIFTATARTLTRTIPPSSLFDVPARGEVSDQGFRDGGAGAQAAAVRPAWVGGLKLWRTGAFDRTAARPFRETVLAYGGGLSWLTVTEVRHWDQDGPFGVGPFAERVPLTGGNTALYEPASASDPRRLSLHTSKGEFLVAGNLPRATLERVAASLPITTIPEPRGWRVHRWAGGVVEDGLSPGDGLARAGFAASMPSFLPPGYGPAAARLVRTPTGRTVTIVFRRPAAELGGIGLMLTQATGQTLAPPSEVGVLAVRIGDAAGRWSPQQHLLEWMNGATYRSLSSPTLGLPTLLRVAQSLRPVETGVKG